jgi:intracellular sulfur oxidation DsrE/DsrF family protein
MTSRSSFLAAAALTAASTGLARPASAAGATFDRPAFEARLRLPFPHRQAFASGQVADGAVLGFMYNSLNAYETGFGEGAGTLHAAAVFYRTAVALALDDDAWHSYGVAAVLHTANDRVTSQADGNPFLRSPQGWSLSDLQRRSTSFFVCQNALGDLARRCGVAVDTLKLHLLPGMMLVPAGVAAVNALQEEHFTLFVATD